MNLGVYDDSTNVKKFARYLRYYTSAYGDDMASLTDYVSRMKENHKDIYYINGLTGSAVVASNFSLECFICYYCGFEVHKHYGIYDHQKAFKD